MSAIARLPPRTDLTHGLALSDRAEMAEPHSAQTAEQDWAARLVCSRCGSRAVDFVLTGVRGERGVTSDKGRVSVVGVKSEPGAT